MLIIASNSTKCILCVLCCVVTTKWASIGIHIDTLRIMFMWHVVLLPVHSIYKIIMMRRIIEYSSWCSCRGPMWTMIRTRYKYGIFYMVYESVLSVTHFTKLVKNFGWKKDFSSQKNSCQLYSSLEMLNTRVVTSKQRPSLWHVN